jgi:hypothetical protein
MFALACSGGGDSNAPVVITTSTPSANTVVFDPNPPSPKIPLPNILATATAVDPIATAWFNPMTGQTVAGPRPYGVPMQPSEALAYVAYREVGGPSYGYPDTTYSTHAVSGVNAPIYFAFSNAVVTSTVNSSTVKVFQVLPDANGLTENTTLGFQDVSGLFDYSATPSASSPNPNPNAGLQSSGTEWLLFPKVPLTPGARYLYVITNGVKDSATGGAVSATPYFEALKSTVPLTTPPLDKLEPVRADTTSSGAILLSGYAKVMNDLITNATADTTAKAGATATGIPSRAAISLMGRFITTGAGGIRALASDGTTLKPMDAIIRAFAAAGLPGQLFPATIKNWNNTVTLSANIPAATYFAGLGLPASTYAGISSVVLGSFHSADLQMDPAALSTATSAGVDATTLAGGSAVAQGSTNPYSFTTGITQALRVSGQLAGFYNTDRTIPFVYFVPSGAPASMPVVILQHGITSQKEAAAAAANTIALSGKATIAIDLPMHGELASPANTVVTADYTTFPDPTQPTVSLADMKKAGWGNDFMSLTSLLTGRTNVQQAALNLHRLELLMRTGAFTAAFAGGAPTGIPGAIAGAPTTGFTGSTITFVGQSLGSIVGAYYLSGNATLYPAASATVAPYSQDTLSTDMKGFLSVPGSTIAYILKDSPSFSKIVNDGLKAASGGLVVPGTTAYTQFFLVAQTLVDPVDPATMTLPLPNTVPNSPLPSRLSGRLAMQEAVGDIVIPNYTTRYLGQALGGRTHFGYDFALGFTQLLYKGETDPKAKFMLGASGFKTSAAAYSPGVKSPGEGYFQFNQPQIVHQFLLGPSIKDKNDPNYLLQLQNTGAAQKQMLFFLGGPDLGAGAGGGASIIVDPYSF